MELLKDNSCIQSKGDKMRATSIAEIIEHAEKFEQDLVEFYQWGVADGQRVVVKELHCVFSLYRC